MTEAEYYDKIKAWASGVSSLMKSNLRAGTSGSGYSQKGLKVNVRETKTGGHRIGFKFPKYGVFVHYGVGRGWVRQGDTVVRGSKVKKNSDVWHQMKKRGYSTKELGKHVISSVKESSGKGGKGRKPVDWFDSVLQAHIEDLADIAAEYYGDKSLNQLSEMLDRLTIGKKKGG